MSLLAKQVVKNKCWVVEDNGKKFGTILANGNDIVLVHNGEREHFPNLKILSERHNILVDKTKPVKVIKESHDVYGYPCEYKANNILWEVQKKLPLFTKGNKSKSFFCAGYYIVQFNNGWVKSYCPKLITLNRYPYQGPFKTLEEMQDQLRIANGITTKSTSQSI